MVTKLRMQTRVVHVHMHCAWMHLCIEFVVHKTNNVVDFNINMKNRSTGPDLIGPYNKTAINLIFE